MISDNNKKKIEKELKNVEVVKGKRNISSSGIKKKAGNSADSLKEKFFSEEEQNPVSQLKKKFFGDLIKGTDSIAGGSDTSDSADDSDIEVGMIKKKNKSADADGVAERTIIVSKTTGLLGSQG